MAKPLLSRDALIRILSAIQNRACNWNRDILTITGCGMTDEEVGAHIMREFTKLSSEDRIAALASAKRIVEA